MSIPVAFATDFCKAGPVLPLRFLITWPRGEILFFRTLSDLPETMYHQACQLVVDARDRHEYLLAPAKGWKVACTLTSPTERLRSLPRSSVSGPRQISLNGYLYVRFPIRKGNIRSMTGHRISLPRDSEHVSVRARVCNCDFWLRLKGSGERLYTSRGTYLAPYATRCSVQPIKKNFFFFFLSSIVSAFGPESQRVEMSCSGCACLHLRSLTCFGRFDLCMHARCPTDWERDRSTPHIRPASESVSDFLHAGIRVVDQSDGG